MSDSTELPVGEDGLALYRRVKPALVELEVAGKDGLPFRTVGVVIRRGVVGAAMPLVFNAREVTDLVDVAVRQGTRSWKGEADNVRPDWGACAVGVAGPFDLEPLETRISTTFRVMDRVLLVAPGTTGHHLAWGTLLETLEPGRDQPYDCSVAWLMSVPGHGRADHALAFDPDGRIAGVVEAIQADSDLAALLPGERLIGVVARSFAEFLMNIGSRQQLVDQYRKYPQGFTDAGSLCVVGIALRGIGSVEEAMAAWVRAAKIDPTNPWICRAVGDALADLGRAEAAAQAHALAKRLESTRGS